MTNWQKVEAVLAKRGETTIYGLSYHTDISEKALERHLGKFCVQGRITNRVLDNGEVVFKLIKRDGPQYDYFDEQ